MTTLVGLLGWPVEHSISPSVHNAVFDVLGMDWRYEQLAVKPEDLHARFEQLDQAGYRGFNVTIPHKQQVPNLAQVEKLDQNARVIGAVNTLSRNPAGGWTAANTDWEGLKIDLVQQKIAVGDKNCLLLGWGGAARAVRYALRNMKAANIWGLSRRPNAVDEISSYDALPGFVDDVDLVVNCTPLGMAPHEGASPWPPEIDFPKDAVLYDLIYNPAVTVLMQTAQEAGAQVVGGIGMLSNQAALSFQQWTNDEPPFELYHQAACDALFAEVLDA